MFSTFFTTKISFFQSLLFCLLQMLSIWTSLKFCCLIKTSLRICRLVKNFVPNDKILDWSKLKAFADDKFASLFSLSLLKTVMSPKSKHYSSINTESLTRAGYSRKQFQFLFILIGVKDCCGKSKNIY